MLSRASFQFRLVEPSACRLPHAYPSPLLRVLILTLLCVNLPCFNSWLPLMSYQLRGGIPPCHHGWSRGPGAAESSGKLSAGKAGTRKHLRPSCLSVPLPICVSSRMDGRGISLFSRRPWLTGGYIPPTCSGCRCYNAEMLLEAKHFLWWHVALSS